MKPVTTDLHKDGAVAVLENWEIWVMGGTAILGFYFQQISLSFGRLATSVAAVSVANPVVSVLLGAIVLQERLDWQPPSHGVIAIAAVAFALLGAVVIASESTESQPNPTPPLDNSAAAPSPT